LEPQALAQELFTAYSTGRTVATPPSARDSSFDLGAAYAVESELVRLRRARGRDAVGRKVGFANKALWRVLKLDTLVWAHMYDDTVQYADGGHASLTLPRWYAPKIEPEIVFKLSDAVRPPDVLAAVEWLALGFEIIDCPFPDWKFQPVDFVAAFGFHAALVVGERRRVATEAIPTLVDQLSRFTVRLFKGDQLVEEGSGRNVLRSPALCLGELAAAIARRSGIDPLTAGEIVSTGTLTESKPIARGETWTARVDGIDLSDVTLQLA
jgi:2-keto-4-pentenoate hydratase